MTVHDLPKHAREAIDIPSLAKLAFPLAWTIRRAS